MKLFRSDLIAGLSDKLFEIPVNELKTDIIQFTEPIVRCMLTAVTAFDGYKISGKLIWSTIEICDCCLTNFPQEHELPILFWLTSNQDLISEVNEDFLWFPDSQDWVDISTIVHDLIYLDEPIKTLCRKDCKGICPVCGQNLNQQTCSCSAPRDKGQWNNLKKVANKFDAKN